MKRKYIIIAIILSSFLYSSCEDYLDVQPEGTLVEDAMFNDVQGFRDAMYGVYSSMGKPYLYGENLTYGFLDKLGQMFIFNNSENIDVYITRYDYDNARIKSMSDTIWAGQYTTISYVNNIIDHLEKTSLKHSDLTLIKGEAHALRAFLHYDIARLFSDNYLLKKDARGIPYSYKFDLNNKKLFSLEKTYENILADLAIAEEYLENDNYISFEKGGLNSDYATTRFAHFNKFAVKALKARVYYSMGNIDDAAYSAKQVIDNKTNFELTNFTNFDKEKRFPGTKEMIFGLYSTDATDNIYNTFLVGNGGGNMVQARGDLHKLYEASTFTADNVDIRYNGYYREESNTFRFIRFLANDSELKTNPVKGLSLIRLPEMYYILAESVYNKDKDQAIALLDEVRKSRGLQPIDKSKVETKENFKDEIMLERMREMPGEGQIFYALKHYNKSFVGVLGRTEIEPSTEIFVLPWPQNELDFGNK